MEEFKVKAYYKYELAALYGVSRVTFCRWIAPIAGLNLKLHQQMLTPLQVQKIVDHLGNP